MVISNLVPKIHPVAAAYNIIHDLKFTPDSVVILVHSFSRVIEIVSGNEDDDVDLDGDYYLQFGKGNTPASKCVC